MCNNDSKEGKSKEIDLDEIIGIGEITWIVPFNPNQQEQSKKHKSNKHKLKDPNTLEAIQLDKDEFSFWQDKQPGWDAIGQQEDTIILVSATPSIIQFKGSCDAKTENNIERIEAAMMEALKYFSKENKDDITNWMNEYYPLASRLTFLYFLNEKMKRKTKLVLLKTVEQTSKSNITEEEWEDEIQMIFKQLTGCDRLPENILVRICKM